MQNFVLVTVETETELEVSPKWFVVCESRQLSV